MVYAGNIYSYTFNKLLMFAVQNLKPKGWQQTNEAFSPANNKYTIYKCY